MAVERRRTATNKPKHRNRDTASTRVPEIDAGRSSSFAHFFHSPPFLPSRLRHVRRKDPRDARTPVALAAVAAALASVGCDAQGPRTVVAVGSGDHPRVDCAVLVGDHLQQLPVQHPRVPVPRLHRHLAPLLRSGRHAGAPAHDAAARRRQGRAHGPRHVRQEHPPHRHPLLGLADPQQHGVPLPQRVVHPDAQGVCWLLPGQGLRCSAWGVECVRHLG